MNVWSLVIADMTSRALIGEYRYGKPVIANDPREDWLQHASS